MIHIRKLVKRYDDLAVLSGISLSVKTGEVAVVIGPSGGGKSTFLRCINGLESMQGGEIEVGQLTIRPGLPPQELRQVLRQVRRRVGFVFQQFNLFPHRTVLGNVIEAPVHVLGKPRDEAIAEARVLLERVGLSAKLDQMPETLSGGQQQRVAIARALAMRPEVILFDEPTSSLDPQMAAEVEAVIAELAAAGQTMIVVTHSMRLARRTAHTLYVFAEGQILEAGPPQQIFEQPREEKTREFLSQAGV